MQYDSIEILLVEDDAGDVELIKESISEYKMKLNTVSNGEEAISYLRNEGKYENIAQPNLIILDINLPLMSGMEVLKEIKEDENLKHIPVIVMTTSDQSTDILKAYKMGANSYVTKPIGIDQFSKIVNSIESFWLKVVKLP